MYYNRNPYVDKTVSITPKIDSFDNANLVVTVATLG